MKLLKKLFSSSRRNKTVWGYLVDAPIGLKLAILLLVLVLILSVVASSLKLKTEAADNIINNNYNYTYKGISIHTKVTGPDGVSATAKKGDTVTFTLTINNPDTVAKSTDVKFTLPPGFTYIAGSASNTGFTQAGQVMTWTGYSAAVGDSTITLKALVP